MAVIVKESSMHVTAILNRAEEGGYVAYNPETGTTTQGETIDEALANLREAVELYLEEFPLKVGEAPLVTTLDVAVHA
jgi:predicted RNase H-like HicB family nuclease